MSLKPSLNILQARRLLPGFDSTTTAAWAAEALAAGYTGEYLQRLSGLKDAEEEVREACFQNAVAEAGFSLSTDRRDLLTNYAQHLVRQVTKGLVEPRSVLHQLREIYIASDYDSRYQAFYFLTEDLSTMEAGGGALLTADLRPDNIDVIITCACAEFLEWEAMNIKPHRWGAVYCFSCGHLDAPRKEENWLGTGKTRLTCGHCGSGAVGDFARESDRERILKVAGNDPGEGHGARAQSRPS